MFDVIIIGAGAAGLAAARMFAEAGKSICILEARDRIGGRIHTLQGQGFSMPVEAGAEFMHGDLPLTKALMKEANVSFQSGEGKSWNVENGKVAEDAVFGYRAAAPALLCNDSYYQNAPMFWDPEKMQLIKK